MFCATTVAFTVAAKVPCMTRQVASGSIKVSQACKVAGQQALGCASTHFHITLRPQPQPRPRHSSPAHPCQPPHQLPRQAIEVVEQYVGVIEGGALRSGQRNTTKLAPP